MKDTMLKSLRVLIGFCIGIFIIWIAELMLDDIGKFLTKPDTELTTSGDDVYICMRGKVNKLVYINGHLFDCVPMADHRSVKLYLRGK